MKKDLKMRSCIYLRTNLRFYGCFVEAIVSDRAAFNMVTFFQNVADFRSGSRKLWRGNAVFKLG